MFSRKFRYSDYIINVGYTFSRSTLNKYQKIWNFENSFSDSAFEHAIGISFYVNNGFFMGAFFKKGAEFSKDVTYDNSNLQIDPIDSSYNDLNTFTIVGYLPNNFNISLVKDCSQNVQILGSINYIFRNPVNENYSSRIEISGNIVRQISKNINVSAGFFETNGAQKQNEFMKSLRAIYLMGGLSIQTKYINIDLTMADSHLLSGVARKQTIGKIGFGFHI